MKQSGRRKKVRPQLGWDCIKRDVRKGEVDDKWRKKAADREKGKGITAEAMQQYIGSNQEERSASPEFPFYVCDRLVAERHRLRLS